MKKNFKKIFSLCLIFAILLTSIVIKSTVSASSTTLQGPDRYATALKIVQAGWIQSDNVVIARGDDMADALSAAPLAYAKGKSPILLTQTNSLPAGVLDQLKSLKVKNVYIVGGTGAVSTAVETALAGFNIIRIAGKDRVETSYNVAIAAFPTAPTKAVIVNGYAYADALSISSIAAFNGMPIILVENNQLSPGVASYVANKTVYAVGGIGVLNDAVVTTANATRLSGANRYETNAAILNKFSQDYNKIYIAKGTEENMVDALAGSALAALGNNPIVLVDGKSEIDPKLISVIQQNISNSGTQLLLGGTVSPSSAATMEKLKDLVVVSID